jgi:hypothetical protein
MSRRSEPLQNMKSDITFSQKLCFSWTDRACAPIHSFEQLYYSRVGMKYSTKYSFGISCIYLGNSRVECTLYAKSYILLHWPVVCQSLQTKDTLPPNWPMPHASYCKLYIFARTLALLTLPGQQMNLQSSQRRTINQCLHYTYNLWPMGNGWLSWLAHPVRN